MAIGKITTAMRVRNHNRLEVMNELRKNPGAVRDIENARLTLSIPPLEYELLKVKYPVLQFGSTHEIKRWFERFILSSDSIPYRVKG